MTRYWKPNPAVVLIAENDAVVADLIATIVEYAGYTPLVAWSGRQALILARENRPALLITDSILPELDGAGLIAALRTRRGPYLPTILVTATPRLTWEVVRPDAVLMKPFHIATLEALLWRFLRFGPAPCLDRSADGCTDPRSIPEPARSGAVSGSVAGHFTPSLGMALPIPQCPNGE